MGARSCVSAALEWQLEYQRTVALGRCTRNVSGPSANRVPSYAERLRAEFFILVCATTSLLGGRVIIDQHIEILAGMLAQHGQHARC